MLEGEGERECQKKAALHAMSSISESSEVGEKLAHRGNCEPSVWPKNRFPGGSDEKWKAFPILLGLGFILKSIQRYWEIIGRKIIYQFLI